MSFDVRSDVTGRRENAQQKNDSYNVQKGRESTIRSKYVCVRKREGQRKKRAKYL